MNYNMLEHVLSIFNQVSLKTNANSLMSSRKLKQMVNERKLTKIKWVAKPNDQEG